MLCAWCRERIPETAQATSRFCGQRCRQAAWRARRGLELERSGERLRLAYADPPYPGTSSKYYRDEPTYAGEVDHQALLLELATFDGWALSTSARALRDVLPLCPPEARVCAWGKPIGVSSKTRGAHCTWEPLIVVVGRRRRPGLRDWLEAQPARGGGELMGRKPIAFVRWMLGLVGWAPGDELADLFPGTGIVGRVVRELEASAAAAGDVAEISRRRPPSTIEPGDGRRPELRATP